MVEFMRKLDPSPNMDGPECSLFVREKRRISATHPAIIAC